MAITDLKGTTWILNDVPVAIASAANSYIAINFESNGQSFSYFIWDDDDYISSGRGLKYTDGSDSSNFNDDYIVFAYNRKTQVWSDEALKTVTFTSNIDVAKSESYAANNFISWLEANGELQKPDPTLTYDLTQLNLDAGTHTISVIAKADGYKASAASASVSYTVEASTVTLEAGTYLCKDEPTSADSVFTENINFISNGTNYTSITTPKFVAGSGYLIYGDTTVCTADTDGWYWANNNYKTVKLETNQEVSEEFATWFNSNFTKQPDTVTIPSGTYVCKDSPSYPMAQTNISFTSNGNSYSSMKAGGEYPDSLLYNTTEVYNGMDGWANSNYKTVKLDTDQEVDETFGTWFNANFEKQPDTVTIEAGTYVANNVLTTVSDVGPYNISFKSNNIQFSYIEFKASAGYDMYYGTTKVYYWSDDAANTYWTNTDYKTITISTPQSVSPEFGEWFNSNFELAPTYSITVDVPNCDYSGDSTISQNGTATVTLTRNTSSIYYVPASVTVTNATYTYSRTDGSGSYYKTGTITLSNPTGDVTISGSAISCFPAGSQVAYDLEGHTKNIESFAPGDYIVSYDSTTGENYIALVKNVRKCYENAMTRITLENGMQINCTQNHPLLTKDGWLVAESNNKDGYGELVIGSIVKTFDGWSPVVSIENYVSENNEPLYQIDVVDIDEDADNDVNDSYYVECFCVHNYSI